MVSTLTSLKTTISIPCGGCDRKERRKIDTKDALSMITPPSMICQTKTVAT